MAAAREKLARAEKAAADHETKPATQLAEQADIDAQIGGSDGAAASSHKAAMEFDASMQALARRSPARNTTRSHSIR